LGIRLCTTLYKKKNKHEFWYLPRNIFSSSKKKRTEVKELLAQDIPPKEHRDDKHREQILADWSAIKKTTIAENTATSLWRKFENHVFLKLGHRPIDKT